MATVIGSTISSGVATLTLDTVSGITAGTYAYVYNVGAPFNGPQVIVTVDEEDDLVTFQTAAADQELVLYTSGLLVTSITWISEIDVEEAIGVVPASEVDEIYITVVTNAANDWAYRRRFTAGYYDNPSVVPGPAVSLGTTIYAQTLYRERAASDTAASFQDFGVGAPVGGLGQIMRLLGINRPQVA